MENLPPTLTALVITHPSLNWTNWTKTSWYLRQWANYCPWLTVQSHDSHVIPLVFNGFSLGKVSIGLQPEQCAIPCSVLLPGLWGKTYRVQQQRKYCGDTDGLQWFPNCLASGTQFYKTTHDWIPPSFLRLKRKVSPYQLKALVLLWWRSHLLKDLLRSTFIGSGPLWRPCSPFHVAFNRSQGVCASS